MDIPQEAVSIQHNTKAAEPIRVEKGYLYLARARLHSLMRCFYTIYYAHFRWTTFPEKIQLEDWKLEDVCVLEPGLIWSSQLMDGFRGVQAGRLAYHQTKLNYLNTCFRDQLDLDLDQAERTL